MEEVDLGRELGVDGDRGRVTPPRPARHLPSGIAFSRVIARKVDIRLPGNSNSRGARPVY